MPSRVRGAISTRRLLKRAPDAMRAELASVMIAAGPEIAGAMRGRAPRGKTGNLVAGVAWKFYPSTLRLVVGFIGKKLNRQLFYARILELGRRAQTVTVTRGRSGGGKGRRYRTKDGRVRTVGDFYQMRVTALTPRRFVYQPATDLRRALSKRLNGIWDRVLQKLSGGGDD